MSLVNQMLKDLEQRRANDLNPKPDTTHSTVNPQKTRRLLRRLMYSISIIIILIMLLGAIYVSFNQFKKSILIKTDKITVASDIPLTTLVQAVAINGDTNNTRLSIYLNKTTSYEISNKPGQNHIDLLLNNAQLAEPLLPLNTHNTLIKNVQVNNVGNQLKVSLDILNKAHIAQLKIVNPVTPTLLLDLTTDPNLTNAAIAPNTATINPATLNPPILAKTGLNNDALNDMQAYIEKIPVPLSVQQKNDNDYQIALNLNQNNQTADAIQLLRKILLRTPSYAMARQALATLLINQQHYAEAERIIQAGIALQPRSTLFIKLAAQLAVAQGNLNQALALLKSIQPEFNTNLDYYALIAALYQRLGYSFKAARLYNQLVSINDTNAVWWLGLATSLEGAGNNKAALEAYQNALATGNLNPQLIEFANNKIHALGVEQ